jgi:hypothetical protein
MKTMTIPIYLRQCLDNTLNKMDKLLQAHQHTIDFIRTKTEVGHNGGPRDLYEIWRYWWGRQSLAHQIDINFNTFVRLYNFARIYGPASEYQVSLWERINYYIKPHRSNGKPATLEDVSVGDLSVIYVVEV